MLSEFARLFLNNNDAPFFFLATLIVGTCIKIPQKEMKIKISHKSFIFM